jgi:hypothetical protein
MNKRKCRNRECDQFFRPPITEIYIKAFWCSPECKEAIAIANLHKQQANRLKAREKAEKKADKAHSEAKRGLKPISHWLKLTQIDFNKFICLRDSKLPCVSCGEWDVEEFHCGHYRSRGAASHLRFTEDNCSKQCSKCNVHLSGNVMEFRLGLFRRIGEERIKALENDNSLKSWTREELDELRKVYRAKIKALHC